MLVPSMYWIISGSSTRGLGTLSGGSTQRISMRRSGFSWSVRTASSSARVASGRKL
jgi:hypothetical protein